MSDNELIAEFMGFPLTKKSRTFSGTGHDIEIPFMRWKYHESWDWLMPVVEKIEHEGYEVDIYKNCCEIPTGDMIRTVEASKIEATHKAVVEFIKWYNATKETTTPINRTDKAGPEAEATGEHD
jgi:hypothetical protein